MNKHFVLYSGMFSIMLILSSCATPTANTNQTIANNAETSTVQDGTPEACGNGICDTIEQDQGLCAMDCQGEETTADGEATTGITQPSLASETITVEEVATSYAGADGDTSGFFSAQQEADVLLSGIDFNNTGGSLLFNHQTGIATDGTHLVLADRNNNRVLIWNALPKDNAEPDLVLGQSDFYSNAPGTNLNELNWPLAVATDGEHLAVTDTYNDRILVWNSWPTHNGEAADFAISNTNIRWPWGVWTNGEKLIVSSTGTSKVLIWNAFPSSNTTEDIVLSSPDVGTPRNIMSDGTNLVVGDHNAFGTEHGSFFWSEFPTNNDEPYDFFIEDPKSIGQETPIGSEIYGGAFTDSGAFIGIAGSGLVLWNSFPENDQDSPDINFQTFSYDGGDGSGVAIADDTVYVSLSNGNRIVAFTGIPSEDREPDFAIGAPDVSTNTYATNYFITNPVPVSNGEQLFVSSDYDRTLSVWKQLPNESNAHPDLVYHGVGGWDNALYDQTFVIVGGNRKDTLYIWNSLPLGQQPDTILQQKIGSVQFQELTGVALDDQYLYIADKQAGKVYVWEGIPEANDDPAYTLTSNEPLRLSSDGEHLVVTRTYNHAVDIYTVADLTADPVTIGGQGIYNLPQGAEIADGHLFIANTGGSAVSIWENINDALAGQAADLQLGQSGTPQIGKDTLFWPATPAYDGSYLWLGEFKFSGRLLRFSPSPY